MTNANETKATLSSGKTVILSTSGWYQPAEQKAEHGDFTAAEVSEAWALWDAGAKVTIPGFLPHR